MSMEIGQSFLDLSLDVIADQATSEQESLFDPEGKKPFTFSVRESIMRAWDGYAGTGYLLRRLQNGQPFYSYTDIEHELRVFSSEVVCSRPIQI